MYIVHFAAELAPIAKVGGLADVLHGLSRELVRSGQKVEIVLPYHGCIDGCSPTDLEFHCTFGGANVASRVWHRTVDELPVYLIEPIEPSFFPRERIYGYLDDVERYTYFSLATLEFLKASGREPDVIHLHEWQTAIAAPLHQGKSAVALTIHNLAHQGQCSPHDLDRVGLAGSDYLTPDRLQDDETPTLINLLKGGVVYADAVNTVSPTYAQEILDGVHHHGLETTLRRHQDKFRGILNGIDTEVWNPDSDPHLESHFSAEKPAAKAECKRWVQKWCGLEVCDRPLLSTITRLAMQKGIPLVREALLHTVDRGGQFVILGTPSTQRIEEEFVRLSEEFRGNPHVHIELDQNEPLAHQLFAGSDLIVAPSLFEPCGLVQLIGMRYGALPLVRKTGGFADTVTEETGFLFEEPEKSAIDSALDRAFDLYGSARFEQMRASAMSQDYSWSAAAKEYLKMYGSICN